MSYWFGQNSAMLAAWATVLVTGVAAAVAWRYVQATWELVRATKDLAETAKEQAAAAKTQAEVTRKMFEAAYRPYVEIRVSESGTYTSPEIFYLSFTLSCHGQLPAVLLGWRAIITPDGEPAIERGSTPDWRECLFPNRDSSPFLLQGPKAAAAPSHHPRVAMHIVVTYAGVPGSRYESHIIARRTETTMWRPIEQWFA